MKFDEDITKGWRFFETQCSCIFFHAQ